MDSYWRDSSEEDAPEESCDIMHYVHSMKAREADVERREAKVAATERKLDERIYRLEQSKQAIKLDFEELQVQITTSKKQAYELEEVQRKVNEESTNLKKLRSDSATERQRLSDIKTQFHKDTELLINVQKGIQEAQTQIKNDMNANLERNNKEAEEKLARITKALKKSTETYNARYEELLKLDRDFIERTEELKEIHDAYDKKQKELDEESIIFQEIKVKMEESMGALYAIEQELYKKKTEVENCHKVLDLPDRKELLQLKRQVQAQKAHQERWATVGSKLVQDIQVCKQDWEELQQLVNNFLEK